MKSMKTIRVTGKGQIRVHPDMTRITIELEGVCKEYADSLARSAKDTEKLKTVLSAFGFQRTDLKTLSFDIDTEYESYRGANGDYGQKLKGYRFRHVLKVEFESDNDRLGKILFALAACDLKPEFRISYTVKDPEAVKNTLLGKAVTDAREKAVVLTQAAGIALKDIQTIHYSWGRIDFEARPMEDTICSDGLRASKMCPSMALDMEPENVDVSDTVTVVWAIG